MNIQIAEVSNMSQHGSSLLRSIQNNSTPLLDLLVRESIQNSLDAAKPYSNSVDVTFEIGEFIPSSLNRFLEGSEQRLNKRFPQKKAEFISIRDSNTEGLTGKLSSKDLGEHEPYGNLLKLVYEIGQPQNKQGAGGSWGLGKTVYFRVGIGLVVYYSRVRTKQHGFESRLAVTHVEDENNEIDRIIPAAGGKKRRGIAWWGQSVAENETIPLTDENEIREILDVFKIEPYKKSETGTTVIIPYIDEKKLLNDNKVEYKDGTGSSFSPYWYSSAAEYLVTSIQRWYAPRIDNSMYEGVYLNPRVISYSSGIFETITSEKMDPAFKAIQDLYNIGISKLHKRPYTSLLKAYKVNTYDSFIRLRSEFSQNSEAKYSGALSFALVSREFLHMNPPDNCYSPYLYYGLPDDGDDRHNPILAYCRKPGMIVEYTDSGKWLQNVPQQGPDEYMIAVFTLNSGGQFKEEYHFDKEKNTLEDYARDTENADHMHWEDISYQGRSMKIIQKTQKGAASKIASMFREVSTVPAGKKINRLSRELGQLLLPPSGFGTSPVRKISIKPKGAGSEYSGTGKKGIDFKIDDHIRYTSEGLNLNLILTATSRPAKPVAVRISVSSESGLINADEWNDEMKIPFPFSIAALKFDLVDLQTGNNKTSQTVTRNRHDYDFLSINLLFTDSGQCFGFNIDTEELTNFKLVLQVALSIFDRSLSPSFTIKELK